MKYLNEFLNQSNLQDLGQHHGCQSWKKTSHYNTHKLAALILYEAPFNLKTSDPITIKQWLDFICMAKSPSLGGLSELQQDQILQNKSMVMLPAYKGWYIRCHKYT